MKPNRGTPSTIPPFALSTTLFLLFSRLQKKLCVEDVGGGEKIVVVGKLKGKLVLKFISISEINPVAFAASKFQYNNPALAYIFFLQKLIDSAINSIRTEFNNVFCALRYPKDLLNRRIMKCGKIEDRRYL